MRDWFEDCDRNCSYQVVNDDEIIHEVQYQNCDSDSDYSFEEEKFLKENTNVCVLLLCSFLLSVMKSCDCRMRYPTDF